MSTIGTNQAVDPSFLNYPQLANEPSSLYPQLEENINQTPILNPAFFRQPAYQCLPYSCSKTEKTAIFSEAELKPLQDSLMTSLNGFHPWNMPNQKNPIHTQLEKIISKLMDHCQNFSLNEKVSYLNEAIAQLVIAAGANTTSPSDLAKEPKFELLEIALRDCLYEELLDQEKDKIADFYNSNLLQFPADLYEREAALHLFATKNNFYCLQNPEMYSILIGEIALKIILISTEKAKTALPLDHAIKEAERYVKGRLIGLQLNKPSQCSHQFETLFRHFLTTKMIIELAGQYREQFQETGTFSRDQMEIDAKKLKSFTTSNVALISNLDIKNQLITETFKLSLGNDPFSDMRANVIIENLENLKKPVPAQPTLTLKVGRWFTIGYQPDTIAKSRDEITKLNAKKLSTIDFVEQEYKTNLLPLTNPNPIYPSIEPFVPSPLPPVTPSLTPVIAPAVPVVLETKKFSPDDRNIPITSYVDISFREQLEKGTDNEKWYALSAPVQMDVLRHIRKHRKMSGKAEEIARGFFNSDEMIQSKINVINKTQKLNFATRLSKEFVAAGHTLLDLYYSTNIDGQFGNFINQFRALKKEGPFFQYVYEMAKAANVDIPSWDLNFAENNWDKEGILPLSVQALERCLHAPLSENND
jgi:hypothetical protein